MRIDWWTLALQTVNVLILIWILSRFFFRPVADIVVERQEEAGKLLSDAAAAHAAAAAARADAERIRAELAGERDRLIGEAHEAARLEKENLLAQAAQEVGKLRSEAKAAVARDRAAAGQAVIAHASELAVEIARRLLGRLGEQVVSGPFLDGLCGELRALAPESRQGLAGAPAGQPIEVVTALPLPDDEMARVRAALRAALGADAPLAFRSDPALIAGIELHFRDMIVRNSWRGDLDRIGAELDRERLQPQS